MDANDYASQYVARWCAVIGAFRPSLSFLQVDVVPSQFRFVIERLLPVNVVVVVVVDVVVVFDVVVVVVVVVCVVVLLMFSLF